MILFLANACPLRIVSVIKSLSRAAAQKLKTDGMITNSSWVFHDCYVQQGKQVHYKIIEQNAILNTIEVV